MNKVFNLHQAYYSIYEQSNSLGMSSSEELDRLRKAAAQATLAGPSKEAQALMSNRTKNILGSQRLKAGIEAQKNVEDLKSKIGMTSREQSPATQEPSRPQESTKSNRAIQPSTPVTPRPTSSLSPEQEELYNRAYQNRTNPFARGRIESAIKRMTPEERRLLQQYATQQGHEKDWKDIGFNFEESYIINHLLDHGYADNVNSAKVIKESMSDAWISSILDDIVYEQLKLPSNYTDYRSPLVQSAHARSMQLASRLRQSGINATTEDPKDMADSNLRGGEDTGAIAPLPGTIMRSGTGKGKRSGGVPIIIER
jgi:hypothetical protein